MLAEVKLALLYTTGGAVRFAFMVNMNVPPLLVAITTTRLNKKIINNTNISLCELFGAIQLHPAALFAGIQVLESMKLSGNKSFVL